MRPSRCPRATRRRLRRRGATRAAGPTSQPAPGRDHPERNDGEAGDPLEAFAESVIGPDGRTQVNATTTYPARAIGQIEGNDNVVGSFICTGWLIDPNTHPHRRALRLPPGTGPDNHRRDPSCSSPAATAPTIPTARCFGDTGVRPRRSGSRTTADTTTSAMRRNLDCKHRATTVGWFGYLQPRAARRALATCRPGSRATRVTSPSAPIGAWADGSSLANKLVFYAIDTSGGQSGSPVWWNRTAGRAPGPAAWPSTPTAVAGPRVPYNGGPRLTTPARARSPTSPTTTP